MQHYQAQQSASATPSTSHLANELRMNNNADNKKNENSSSEAV